MAESTAIRTIAWIALLAGALLPFDVVSQAGTYPLESAGQDIAWNDDWELITDRSTASDAAEVVTLGSGTATLLISTLPANLDLSDSRDLVLDGLAAQAEDVLVVERGAYDSVAYALELIALDGAAYGAFMLLTGGVGDLPTVIVLFLSPVDEFAEGLETAQQGVTIDERPALNGVAGAGLQQLLDDRTDELDVTAPAESATETRDDALLGGTDLDPAFESLGVVEQGTYASPLHGTTVDWVEDYALDVTAPAPVDSDEDAGIDTLRLAWTGDGSALVTILVQGAGSTTPADVVAYWISDGYLASSHTPGASIVVSDVQDGTGGVIVRDILADGSEVVIYREVRAAADGEALVLATYSSDPALANDALAAAQAGIEIDGTPAFDLFTVDEVIG